VTYVILSKYPNGASNAELESAVVKFLSDPASQSFAWYLGMTDRLIQRAQEPTKFPGWFDFALDTPSKGNMAELDNDLIKFRSRNFSFGWEEE
jgi:hypothetical protein